MLGGLDMLGRAKLLLSRALRRAARSRLGGSLALPTSVAECSLCAF